MGHLRLSLEALEVLDAIDRRGSFAAAADELHRVPSAVTYTIRKLEDDLDTVLFDRRGHRAVLTPAGRELLEQGRHLLRAAGELEHRVRRLATGWETELRIACDDMIDIARLLPLVDAFYRENARENSRDLASTRLRLSYEVLGGTWDALASGRADLVIGVSGDAPASGGCSIRPLGRIEFLFAVAPSHPLASLPEPLVAEQIQAHRAVAIADTSRNLPPRSVGLLSGQDVLTVPDLESKIAAQVAGLGCGYLPKFAALLEVGARRLVVKNVEGSKPEASYAYAWRSENRGRALRWFLHRLDEPAVRASLLGELQGHAAPGTRRKRRKAISPR